jgi:hypothetical protein
MDLNILGVAASLIQTLLTGASLQASSEERRKAFVVLGACVAVIATFVAYFVLQNNSSPKPSAATSFQATPISIDVKASPRAPTKSCLTVFEGHVSQIQLEYPNCAERVYLATDGKCAIPVEVFYDAQGDFLDEYRVYCAALEMKYSDAR